MSQVSGTRNDAPVQRATSRPSAQRKANPEDVRAMSDAFAGARVKMAFETPAKPGKPALPKGLMPEADRKAAEAALGAAFDRKVAERQQSERQADGQGFALPGQLAPPPPPIVLAAMPAPQVDPSAFAQMLADLWTRENGKGAKEVRVTFGADAWPATDALLIRNAAGSLDIAIGIARGGGAMPIGGLNAYLEGSGLQVGSLTIAPSDQGTVVSLTA